MAEAKEPVVVNPAGEEQAVRLTKAGKPFREQRRGKIAALPEEARAELDRRLATNSFRNYRGLSQWLEDDYSARISPSALNYRKHTIDLQLLPVEYATKEAQKIVEATGGDNEQINRVLTVLVQTTLFDMLVDLYRTKHACDQVARAAARSDAIVAGKQDRAAADAVEVEPSAEAVRRPLKIDIAAVSMLTKNTTAIGEHVRRVEQWEIEREELWQKVETARQKVTKVAREAGLSPATEKKIRAALMEIKP